jgi:uncharacterized membrane protein YbhN (UPF0104 family)
VLRFEQTVRVDFDRSINRYVAARAWLALPGDFYYAILHFVVTIGVLVWLWYRRPDHYRRARRVLVAGTLVALVVFWVFPAAPPRLLPGSGFVDTNVAYHTIFDVEQGGASKGADLYATMPSLHLGWSLWCAWALSETLTGRWARWGVYAYPAATALVVMGTGNHFVVDLIGGSVVMVLGGLIALGLPRVWSETQSRLYRSPGRAWAPVLKATAGPLLLLVVGLSLRSTLSAGLRAVGHADPLWLLAILAEAVSLASFAALHRRALRVTGFDVGRSTVAAVTLASNAISSSLPLVGSAAGTANTWRQYYRRGASASGVTWALAASGAVSSVAFTLMVAVGALASGNWAVIDTGLAATLTTFLLAGGAVTALRLPPLRARLEQTAAAVMHYSPWLRGRSGGADPVVAARRFIDQFRSYRSAAGDICIAVSAGVLNWAADVAALAIVIAAVGGHVSLADVIVVWAVAGTATSVGLTPAGIGIVEPVLVAGLLVTGIPRDSAVAATLLYRLVGLLLPVSVGWIVQLSLVRALSTARITVVGGSRPRRGSRGLPATDGHLDADDCGRTRWSPSPRQTSRPRRPCRPRRPASPQPTPLRITDLSAGQPETSASNVTVAFEQ